MEKIKVLFRQDVENYLNELVLILYEKGYFSFPEEAIAYVDNIVDFITENIVLYPAKDSPLILSKFGSRFIRYKSNIRTTWYIFFERNDSVFFITYICNNHHPSANFLLLD